MSNKLKTKIKVKINQCQLKLYFCQQSITLFVNCNLDGKYFGRNNFFLGGGAYINYVPPIWMSFHPFLLILSLYPGVTPREITSLSSLCYVTYEQPLGKPPKYAGEKRLAFRSTKGFQHNFHVWLFLF